MNAGVDLDVLAGPTRHGIDLVAIERVRNGQPAALNAAELEYLFATYDGTVEQGRLIAAVLGTTRSNVEKRCAAARARTARRAT